ncbi:hypothetical protein [Hymenobacter sp.]|uniref:hypothetical protein n=1 Tax=Hymenobacter sp. TaxID=1898978 RepID=UPI002EDA079A
MPIAAQRDSYARTEATACRRYQQPGHQGQQPEVNPGGWPPQPVFYFEKEYGRNISIKNYELIK